VVQQGRSLFDSVLSLVEHGDENAALPVGREGRREGFEVGLDLPPNTVIFLDQFGHDLVVCFTSRVTASQIIGYFINFIIFFVRFYFFAIFWRPIGLVLKLSF
jgi:hypothetical protein